MTFRYSVDMRNAGIDARIKRIGPSPTLKIFAGLPPANCATEDPKNLLVSMRLPKDWMRAAIDGAAEKQGIWAGTAVKDGDAQCFRICSADGTCHMQGGIPAEMILDNTSIAQGQNVAVASFVISSGNG